MAVLHNRWGDLIYQLLVMLTTAGRNTLPEGEIVHIERQMLMDLAKLTYHETPLGVLLRGKLPYRWYEMTNVSSSDLNNKYLKVVKRFIAKAPSGFIKALSRVLAPKEKNHSVSASRSRVKLHLARPEMLHQAAEATMATVRARKEVIYSGSPKDRGERENRRLVTSFLQLVRQQQHEKQSPPHQKQTFEREAPLLRRDIDPLGMQMFA